MRLDPIATLGRIRDLTNAALPGTVDELERLRRDNAWLRECIKRLGQRYSSCIVECNAGERLTLRDWAEQVLSGGPPPAPGEIPDLWGDTLKPPVA